MTPTLHLARGTISLCVHAALEEAGIAHHLHWVDFAADEQRGAAYLAVNPKGRVPALVTGDGTLTEAIALLDWIAATGGGGLMPADPWEAAKAREMMGYLGSTAHVNHAHKMRGARWADDADAQASMQAKVQANMTGCAAFLEDGLDGDWVAGGRFSVADLYLWNVVRWLPGDGVPMAEFPRLAAHRDRVAARPAVARVAAMHG